MSGKKAQENEKLEENHKNNVDLYNKYLIFASSVLVAIIFNNQLKNGAYAGGEVLLKIAILSLLVSVVCTVLELGLLILRDGVRLRYISMKCLRKIVVKRNKTIEWLVLIGFITFIAGLVFIGLFIVFL